MPMYGIYIMSSFFYSQENGRKSSSQASYSSFKDVAYENIFHVGGISGGKGQLWLLWLTIGLFFMSSVLWVAVVFIQTDPGIVNTRDQDFEEVLAQSLLSSGPPPSTSYCRTTLVKKPLRSKYCTKTGAVVARMDHYCFWLNITVGFGNHRAFILLILSHLLVCSLGVVLTTRSVHVKCVNL